MNVANMVLLGAVFLPFLCGIVISVFLFKRAKKGRRSPLTGNLLRGPGETLRRQIEENLDKVSDHLFRLLLVAVPAYALLFLFVYIGGNRVEYWQLVLVLLMYFGTSFWATRRLYLSMIISRNLYLGLDAELAVGQELNQLMLQGCRVFHDFPAEEFNIDHVVVGLGGVFAVETKGRAKPNKGRGNVDAKVFYDGEALKFPDWYENKPLSQAKRQAAWLSKWLSSAVGEKVKVMPVLALPGWFVERTKTGDVIVINGKSPSILAKPFPGQRSFDEKLIQQISHQLEQRCRDVEPVGYKKDKKKAA